MQPKSGQLTDRDDKDNRSHSRKDSATRSGSNLKPSRTSHYDTIGRKTSIKDENEEMTITKVGENRDESGSAAAKRPKSKTKRPSSIANIVDGLIPTDITHTNLLKQQ